MARRITLVLDDALLEKARERQSKLIKESVGSVSFSRVLNGIIREGLQKD